MSAPLEELEETVKKHLLNVNTLMKIIRKQRVDIELAFGLMNTEQQEVFLNAVRLAEEQEKEIEDILAERGINEILKSQGIPLRKKGEEYSYQMSPNFSLYKNPAEMGVKFESRFADGGIASAITKIKKNPKVEKYAVGALVPIGGAIARAAPTAISRIRQILDGGRKVKDMGKAKVVDDIADAKIVDDVAEETVKRSGNIFTRNPVTTTVGGLLLGAGVAPSLVGGGEEETINEGDGSGDGSGSGGDGGGGGSEPIDLSGVPNETIGVYARKILQQKGFFFNNETGRFEAQLDADGNVIQGTPKFLDYLKAFGSGYLEKVSEDPDFAKKMMAGFAAMTMPKEGPTGFSPLGLSEFTQGYLGADIALQEANPADQKILEYLQQNPDQQDALYRLQASKQGFLSDVDEEKIREQYEGLVAALAQKQNITSFDIKDYNVVDSKTGDIYLDRSLYKIQSESPDVYYDLLNRLMLTKKD